MKDLFLYQMRTISLIQRNYLCWTLLENGLPIDHDTITALNIAPQSKQLIELDLPRQSLKAGNEYHVNFSFMILNNGIILTVVLRSLQSN